MPLLVSDFAREPRNTLGAPLVIAHIAKLNTMRPQPIAQPALLGLQTTPRLVVPDREQFEGLARPRLRCTSCPLDGIFKILAKFGGE